MLANAAARALLLRTAQRASIPQRFYGTDAAATGVLVCPVMMSIMYV